MATKKTDDLNRSTGVTASTPMAATTAQTQQDVNNMTRQQRLWDSLNYTYGTQIDESNRNYAKAYSDADRQMLGRGMQRSSYGSQTLANINQQKLNAANKITSQKIADYENRLNTLEQQEQEQSNWERQFEWQQKSADQQIALSFIQNILAKGGTPSDELLARAGLSRADYDAMKAQASGGGVRGGRYRGGGGGDDDDGTTTDNGEWTDADTQQAAQEYGDLSFANRTPYGQYKTEQLQRLNGYTGNTTTTTPTTKGMITGTVTPVNQARPGTRQGNAEVARRNMEQHRKDAQERKKNGK